MWEGPKGGLEYLVNVMWPMTTFTRENGGTRLWTGSNFDQDVPALPEEESVVPTVAPGDALIFLGSTLLAGGGNASAAPRRGIVISYCLRSHERRVGNASVSPCRYRLWPSH